MWITGASSGIGEATAVAFAREGARLILSARRREELQRVAQRCVGAPSVEVLPLDLGDLASLPSAAQEALERTGRIDVMVHNAGISQRARAIDTSLEVDERIMRVNFLGTVALTKALLPAMVAARRGHFVVVTSLTGLIGSPMRSTYAASKHALHGFFDSLRAEHHADGIRVTMVCPGFVHTAISIHALTGDGTPQGTMDRATARGIPPEDCARALLDATARRAEEVYVGGLERLGVYLARYAPRVFSVLLRHARVT